MRWQAKHRFVLLTELCHQSGFPRQILLHGLTIAGVAVVYKKQVIDTFMVGRYVG